jgi:hypothetical protein
MYNDTLTNREFSTTTTTTINIGSISYDATHSSFQFMMVHEWTEPSPTHQFNDGTWMNGTIPNTPIQWWYLNERNHPQHTESIFLHYAMQCKLHFQLTMGTKHILFIVSFTHSRKPPAHSERRGCIVLIKAVYLPSLVEQNLPRVTNSTVKGDSARVIIIRRRIHRPPKADSARWIRWPLSY